MESRIDTPLSLGPGGTSVTVTGPIVKWEDDEDSAIFTTVIAQVKADGSTVMAIGHSAPVGKGAATWQASAHVEGGGKLMTGAPAVGWAIAAVRETDGCRPYPWQVSPIALIETVVSAGRQG